MSDPMRVYIRLIQSATGSDAATARLVLGLMLSDHNGIVSDLAPADFQGSALFSLQEVAAFPTVAARIAETWGLPLSLGEEGTAHG